MPQTTPSMLRRHASLNKHSKHFAGLALLAALVGAAGTASAQDGSSPPGGYELTGAAPGGGGGSSSGGDFSLDGSIGQVAAGDMSGGDFDVSSGSLTSSAPMCELADLNCNGTVDGADLGLLLLNWGPCDPSAARCIGDINTDGLIDGADLALLLSYWT